MRRVSILILSSLFTVIMTLSSTVHGQTASSLNLPDYTAWEKGGSGTISVTLNGRDTQLKGEAYHNSNKDHVNPKRSLVEVIYNQAGDPWIAVYTEETGEVQPGGGIITKESNSYLFERANGKWEFVRNLLETDMQGFVDLLKNRYGLEIK